MKDPLSDFINQCASDCVNARTEPVNVPVVQRSSTPAFRAGDEGSIPSGNTIPAPVAAAQGLAAPFAVLAAIIASDPAPRSGPDAFIHGATDVADEAFAASVSAMVPACVACGSFSVRCDNAFRLCSDCSWWWYEGAHGLTRTVAGDRWLCRCGTFRSEFMSMFVLHGETCGMARREA